MATDVQVFRSGAYESIDFASFQIDLGISTRLVAPKATIRISPRESISPGQAVRIQIGGVTKFEGSAGSGGTKRENAPMKVPVRHDAAELFNTTATLSLTSPTDKDVLQAALNGAGTQASFTLNFVGATTALGNDYDVDDRQITSIFRDMMDRTGRVWWVDPASNTIHVETEGGGGSWKTLDTETDRMVVSSFDTGSVETVVNDVTVTGTGGEAVTGTASDATSQSNYGVRSKSYNVEYALTQAESDAIASSLIQADPIAEGEIRVGRNVGAIEDPQVNKTIDLTDDSKDISATGLVIEQQTIEQGRARMHIGGGMGASVAENNRAAKSQNDITLPGSVFGEGRLADDSVSRQKIKDRAVDNARIELSTIIADNMADSAISSAKIADAAVTNIKVDDLAISETKIQDNSIATPKLQAEAVTANEILAGTVTANEIDANTITASEIAAGTIGASRLFVEDWIPVGLTFTDSDPDAFSVSWNAHTLVYNGTEYSINADNTSDKYIYWQFGDAFYSTSTTKPTLGADDCLVAINESATASQVLQATEIHGGAIRTGTVAAAEIKAASITADLIDVLNLATGEMTVGSDADTAIEFGTSDNDGTDQVDIFPSTSNFNRLGTQTNPFFSLNVERVQVPISFKLDTSTTPDVVEFLNQSSGEALTFEADGSTGRVNLVPDVDNAGQVGTSSRAVRNVYSHNYVTASPDVIESVDLTTIKDVDWYDNPPTAVEDRAKDIGPTDNAIPEGRDHIPVELGTMANWLLETCKAQQDRIDDLEERLQSLEKQV